MAYGNVAPPPIFGQSTQALQGNIKGVDIQLLKKILLHEFKSRTVPDIIHGQGARGSYWSGATTRKVGRAAEDLLNTFASSEYDYRKLREQLSRNQFLIGLGVQL